MKGLLIKDIINLKGYAKSLIGLLVFFTVISCMSGDISFLSGMTIIFSVSFSMSSFTYDNYSKWDSYAMSLPITRKDMVKSKYVFALIIAGAGTFLALIILLIVGVVNGFTDMGEKLTVIGVLLIWSVIAISVMLPFMYKYGVDKARFIMMGIFLVPTVLIMVVAKLGLKVPAIKANTDIHVLAAIIGTAAVAATIALLVVSYRISCKVYMLKDL